MERQVKRDIETAWPTMEQLGLTERGTPDSVRFASSAAAALEGAGLVQENVPERLPSTAVT